MPSGAEEGIGERSQRPWELRTKRAQSRHYAHRPGANQLPEASLRAKLQASLSCQENMPKESVADILARAKQRGQAMRLPYAGALLPAEAHALMQELPATRLV